MAQEDVLERREKLVFLCLILAQRGALNRGVCHPTLPGIPACSFCEQRGQPRSRRRFSVRERGSCRVRSVVLGCPYTLKLACSSRASVVLDPSGAGQWHRSLVPCLVARRLLPRRGDSSVTSVVRWLGCGPPGSSSRSVISLAFLKDRPASPAQTPNPVLVPTSLESMGQGEVPREWGLASSAVLELLAVSRLASWWFGANRRR
jgi:hypothetical protein